MVSKVQSQKIANPDLKSVRHLSCLAEHSRELFKINSNPSVRVYESVADPVENVDDNLRKVSLIEMVIRCGDNIVGDMAL